MGKVLRAVAVIAVTAAIAAYAPQLGLAFLHAFGSAAVAGSAAALAAGAAVGAVLSVAAAVAVSAFAPRPHTSTAPGQQPSRGQPMEQGGFGFRYPADPTGQTLPAIREPWWRDDVFLPWGQRAVCPVRGTCMRPVMPDSARWVVIDRFAPIRAGDLFLFRPDDLVDYMRAAGGDPRVSGLVKRLVGVDPERRVVVYETTNPPNRMETGLDRVLHAYRVTSWHTSWWAAVKAKRCCNRLKKAGDLIRP
ncbi:hypothetical protein SAMN05192583_0563 [Sphingomonas gellani]|uniref:Uncharacterized protein n=1 Tax=Sphingomonas gellani TaxID=1166340 RepID=A0A1H7Z9G0_9SPHN|nr:S24/S26 family peptidase [Sphingomonas gellani]SEM54139.1 hypothetical protein SAMN05192583_0563 [Sphingomonas gellani]